jgi:hypothetical protein
MIGIKDQVVEYPTQLSAIEDKKFQFPNDDKIYMILDDTFSLQGVNKINPLLKDDEITMGTETIFTYIIGTQIMITENKQLIRDIIPSMDRECRIEDMHIWAKLALSTQEINTKHNSILNDSYINYLNIESSILNNKEFDKTDVSTGIIDRIFYAGELKIDKNKNVYINFLSGTFMDKEQIPCENPPENSKICIETFFKKIEANSVTIDTSCKTFINRNMTKDLLDEYVVTGNLQVGVFNNNEDASKYKQKNTNLSRIKNQISKKEYLILKFPNNVEIVTNATEEIKNLEQEYNDLLSNNFNMIKYSPTPSGGKKNKTKRRRFYKKRKNKNSKKIKRVN